MYHLSSPEPPSRWPEAAGSLVDGRSRVVFDGATRLFVLGNCYADDRQLWDGLEHVRSGRWARLTEWPGSYWVVADTGDTMAVITDVAGTRPVYFAETPTGTQWSTSARALASRFDAALDYEALTARLVCPTVPEVVGDGTSFEGVRRLPGGHVLLVQRDGRHRIQKYEEPRTVPFEAAAAELREALLTGIASRTQAAGKITADFSGGLDSTSLALLATGTAGAEVFAVTHADTTSRNEDVEYALRAAADQPGLRHELVSASDGLFFSELLGAPGTDQPFPDAARWRMRAAYQRPCTDHGSDLHLTGSGADTLLSASPFYLADLARERKVSDLMRHCLARARLRHLPTYAVAAGAAQLSRTTHARALQHLAYDLAARPGRRRPESQARLHWIRASGASAWLTPDARRCLSLRAASAAEGCSIPSSETSRHRAWAELHEFGTYEAELRNQSHGVGLPHHAPFLDSAVVRAAMAIPVRERASTTAQKPLLGAALKGLVPDWLLARRTKGAYDGNAYTGLRRNVDVLRHLLAESRLAAEGWIDRAVAGVELERLAAGVPGNLAALEALITTELWLQRQRTSTVAMQDA
ncbi:albusnodin/ikarugamycin family macrolactam cyclase [Streptomyces cavernicola]|uniref:asparagine synthase (glutamine-hydrolyzing) n=1 Tax=Streptomyces cavernicola TaxID=3043613 RepID=A0ABT6SCM2_9ACTN|nr:albusnodin/ikarugamycin family macrolactam cyclase [Streptomyces sp. B-S-A6]MDI3405947.1 albusnodin/ikarugamycin family macrolactam cyclase [Streptomyces sp. B-S-A6]